MSYEVPFLCNVQLCRVELELIFGKHKTLHETLMEFQFYHLRVYV